MLDNFVSGNAKAPETPAALLKLGHCLKRLGSTLADPNERNNRPTTKVMGQLADSTIPKTAEHLASPPTRSGPIMTAAALTVSHA